MSFMFLGIMVVLLDDDNLVTSRSVFQRSIIYCNFKMVSLLSLTFLCCLLKEPLHVVCWYACILSEVYWEQSLNHNTFPLKLQSKKHIILPKKDNYTHKRCLIFLFNHTIAFASVCWVLHGNINMLSCFYACICKLVYVCIHVYVQTYDIVFTCVPT